MTRMANDIEFPDGWDECVNPDGFAQELRRELAKGHALYGREVAAIAVRDDGDDVLFRTPSGEMFVIHLTWTEKPERLPWPLVVWKSTRHDFAEFTAWSSKHYSG